jgi:hypothetical protein
MPGPAPKPADERQGRHRADLGIVYRPDQIPEIPPNLCPAAQDAWTSYWSDLVAGAVRVSDSSLINRWIANVDRYHRLMGVADAEPIVVGSTGQPKPNGLYDLAFKVEASIKADEQQLGIGPYNRLRLGVKLTEGAKSLADLTRAEVNGDDGDSDPRLFLVGS